MAELAIEPRRGRKTLVNLGLFIKDYLTEQGEACQQDIHESYRNKLREIYESAGKRFTRQDRMKYHSFTRFFYFLKQLGFVEESGKEETSSFQEFYSKAHPGEEVPREIPPRVYYRLTDKGKTASDVAWSNPLRALYPKFDSVYYSNKSRQYAEERKLKGLPAKEPFF